MGTDDDMDCVDESGGGRREEVSLSNLNFFAISQFLHQVSNPVKKEEEGAGGQQAGLHVPDDEPHPVLDQHGRGERQAGGEVNFTPKK